MAIAPRRRWCSSPARAAVSGCSAWWQPLVCCCGASCHAMLGRSCATTHTFRAWLHYLQPRWDKEIPFKGISTLPRSTTNVGRARQSSKNEARSDASASIQVTVAEHSSPKARFGFRCSIQYQWHCRRPTVPSLAGHARQHWPVLIHRIEVVPDNVSENRRRHESLGTLIPTSLHPWCQAMPDNLVGALLTSVVGRPS